MFTEEDTDFYRNIDVIDSRLKIYDETFAFNEDLTFKKP